MMNDQLPPLTRDAFYGGRITLDQPEEGFRGTSDAILLAAAVPPGCQHILELGAGVGAATLALAARRAVHGSDDDMHITAVERDPVIAAILTLNVANNQMDNRITVCVDDALTARPPWAGCHDLVMINPPYNDAASTVSENQQRLDAMAGDDLKTWINAGYRGLADKGRLVMISRADRLDEVMDGMHGKFGDLSLKAIHTRPDQPAKRVIISGRKGVAGPVHLLPPLMMRDENNKDSQAMRVISHDAGRLEIIPPGRDIGRVRLPHRG